MSKIINKVDILDNKIIEIIETVILKISKERKELYHQFKLPIEETLETIIIYGIGNILNRDIDLDIINESKKIFIKNAKQTILYRLETEDSAWSTGIEFLNDLNIKYRENIYELFKYYSLGCYTMHYKNLVWCCISEASSIPILRAILIEPKDSFYN